MLAAIIERRKHALAVGLAALTAGLYASGVRAQERAKALRPVQVLEKRALLIGNTEYCAGVAPLEKTMADVDVLGRALEDLGFVVRKEQDLSEREMVEAVRDFRRDSDPGDLAFSTTGGTGWR